jgi:hypothetical protein
MKNKRHARAWKPRPIPRFFKKRKTKRQKKIVYVISQVPCFWTLNPDFKLVFISKHLKTIQILKKTTLQP